MSRIQSYAPVVLSVDVGTLPESERRALRLIIEASKELDPIFERQVWARNPELRSKLGSDLSSLGRMQLAYFEIHRGPWDRQRNHEGFATVLPHPKGAGFYPEDMSVEEFERVVREQPDRAESLRSLVTMVDRDEKGELAARPYSQFFGFWLERAAAKLRLAADATQNASLAHFLRARAKAFETDDYYESDKLWMDLDSRVEVTIGPYETYEDQLLGLKASFESFVTVSDPEASKALTKYKALLPEMEKNLPVPDEMKTERGRESPIRVVDLVFSSGDARKSVQTIAFNLPNDERVRKEKGAKKVLLRNLIETKFQEILRPLGYRILAQPHQAHLDAKAFFTQVLFHELSHSLGPAFTRKDAEDVEVRLALGAAYSPIEECKADVMGAYNVLFMIERGELDASFREPFLTSYFAGLFRSVRFGVSR
ncbi:MAG: hypothetical protein HC923_13450, partial [Myxococcales bacterium]|nr:hypothetical protein [Myxococcales bacterium]